MSVPARCPGPDAIDPGTAPGGIVLRVYNHEAVLLAEQRLAIPADSLRLAHQARALTDRFRRRGPVAVVVYDGDTGRLWGPDDYRAIGVEPGDRIV